MNFNRGLADLYRQYLRNGTTPPPWLRKAVEPAGDRLICNVRVWPRGKSKAKGRKPYTAHRVVDRKIWAKLDDAARGRFIERIRREVGA
jgi:hypothetical protein